MKYVINSLIVAFFYIIQLYPQSAGWSIQSSPTTENLYGIALVDTSIWVAVGNSGIILRSNDGGISWVEISSPVGDQLRGVAFNGNVGLAVGISGRVLRSTDAGLSWIEENRPVTKDLYSVSMSNQMSVITGHEGTILVSLDDGVTWTQHFAGTASNLFGVSVNDSTAVGVGGQGAVVMSVNGGNGWGLTVVGDQLTFYYSTSFVNSSTGWAVGSSATTGNVIIHSNDYGFVWNAQTAPTTEQLFGVSFVNDNSGSAVGGNGTIMHTSDGGINWVIQLSGTTQILNSVSFANTNLGIAVGNGGTILRTATGGVLSVDNNRNQYAPNIFSLQQNYPNPFNPTTTIQYYVPHNSMIKLTVFNAIGEVVALLVNEEKQIGVYNIEFNAKDMPSGIYFYRIQAGNFVSTKKMILLR